MSVHVQIDRRVRGAVDAEARRALARVARAAGRRLGFSSAELAGLGLRLVDDATITELCRVHLGDAHVTDVLSFPAGDDPFFACAGDIAIDWAQVQRQASAPGVRARAQEATQLLVHGLAHLAGHDHGTRAQARRMLRAERAAARAAGLAPPRRSYGGDAWSR
jgi:probable rRNA maturation factor